MSTRFIVLLVILVLIDIYVFRTFVNQFSGFPRSLKYTIYGIYWLVPVFLISSTIYGYTSNGPNHIRESRAILYAIACLVLFYIPKLLILFFQGVEDFSKIGAWVTKKLSQPESNIYSGAEKISRSVFIGRLGLIIASIPFASILYGIVKGRFNFTVTKKTLYFDNLPEKFDSFKIAQFSDFHAGSLIGQQENFKKAIQLINSQQADIIVFTGDMVNSRADELDDWLSVLSELKAKQGKFSILGNHDYGDYYQWDTQDEKVANLQKLKDYHKQLGFKLMLNENHIFEKEGEKIALLGVENWGKKPFPQLGRLDEAMKNAEEIPFKVLLSHDPSHWDEEVLGKTNIDLTLSGHTHGMQLAINVAGYSWSPVSMRYPRWKGLYTENNQHLYVNIGLGYIGFPGRVGTDPEITVIELKKNNVV
jgi:predicted MPP superfamily phosphohydrolase